MSLLHPAWLAASRPTYEVLDVLGVGCVCGRRVYVDQLKIRDALERRDESRATLLTRTYRCRGCDELDSECYCPDVEAVA